MCRGAGVVVGRRGGELGHEPDPVEAVDVMAGHTAVLAGDHADGDDGVGADHVRQSPVRLRGRLAVTQSRRLVGRGEQMDGSQVIEFAREAIARAARKC